MVAVTAELAKRATALAWRDFPDDLIERTKQCLLDWFAVTVAGAQEELTEILVRDAIEDGAKGKASLVGRSENFASRPLVGFSMLQTLSAPASILSRIFFTRSGGKLLFSRISLAHSIGAWVM